MTIEMFCPKWYYTGAVSEDNQIKIRELFGEFLSNDENFSDPDGWNCNVSTTMYNDANLDAPWSEFLNCIKSVINDFLEETQPMKDIEVVPQEAWANRYKKGQFQEYHEHAAPNCNVSMVYFYEEPDETLFRFYDNDDSKYKSSGLKDVLSIPSGTSIIPKVKQGDVMLFPSFYPHYVCPNNSDSERITFSANFLVTPQQPAQGSPQSP